MLKHLHLTPEFVSFLPKPLIPGQLYISPEYGTVAHSCCCGCGTPIFTPLTPTDWKITYDGETITLFPSVGNWNIPCQSHYIIDRNRVIECGQRTSEKLAGEHIRNASVKARHDSNHLMPPAQTQPVQQTAPAPTWWEKIRSMLTEHLF